MNVGAYPVKNANWEYWHSMNVLHVQIWRRVSKVSFSMRMELHQLRLWFITGGYLVKRWFLPAAARARGQSNDLNKEILASNLFNCRKEVINTAPVPSISRCIHIVYRHKNVWEYQWSNFFITAWVLFFTMFVAKMPSSTAAPLAVKGANH